MAGHKPESSGIEEPTFPKIADSANGPCSPREQKRDGLKTQLPEDYPKVVGFHEIPRIQDLVSGVRFLTSMAGVA